MQIKVILLFLLFSQFALGQHTADLTGKCIECDINSEHVFILRVYPENKPEKDVFLKSDSGLVAYLKNVRLSSNSKDLALPNYYGQYPLVEFNKIEKYLDMIAVDDITVSGTWNKSLDTLYVWGISNGYRDRFDTLNAIYRPFAFPLFKYAQCMSPSDYNRFLDILIHKVKNSFGIVADTVNAVDYARVIIKNDSSVLPQASVKLFAKKIMDSWQEGSTDPYKDYYLTQRIYNEDHRIKDPADTKPQLFVPDKIVATEEWAFFTLPAIKALPQINYNYGFIGVRKKISIGVVPKIGESDTGYVDFTDFKRHINYKSPHAFDPFEQSVEALFYKKYDIKCIYDDWE